MGGVKYLVPSTLGIGLIEGYNRIGLAKNVSKPQLRREVGTHRNPHLSLNPLFFGRPNVEWCKFAKAQVPKMICSFKVLTSINICTLLLKESLKKSLRWVPLSFGRCLQLTF